MDRTREASEQLHHQRAGRLRVLRAELARLAAVRAGALARGNARLAADYEARIRRTEQSLAALERTIAAEEIAPPP